MHSRRAATECAPLPGPRLGLTGAESRATDPGELGLGRGGDAAAAVAGYTATVNGPRLSYHYATFPE